jgi:photosystem II stability/assembly factor-like uncharacterized protein
LDNVEINFTQKSNTMKTLKLFTCLLILGYSSMAQTPAIHSTLPVGGTVSKLQFKGTDTAFCIIGVNLYRSIDGAKNWTLSKGLQFGGPYNFVCLAAKGNKVLAGLNSGGRYYESNDGGNTWSDVKFLGPNERVSDFQILNEQTIFAICSGNSGSVNDVKFMKSSDGGTTWSTPVTFPIRGYDAQVQFINSNLGMVYYQEQMYRSTNGGSAWDTAAGFTDDIKTAFILNEQLAFAGTDEGTLSKSTDGLNNWTKINPNGNLDWENQIYFLNESKGLVSTGYTRDFAIHTTTNGGQNWSTFANGVNFKKFVYINDQTIYLYGGNNNIYKTSLSSTGLNSSIFNPIKIYPNPSNGTFQLELEKEYVGKEIKLFDVYGKIQQSFICTSTSEKIENRIPGLFLIKIGEETIGRILIQ